MGVDKNLKDHISLDNKTILVTGAAGFIGYHLVLRLLKESKNSTIIGIDNFTDYYDVSLKEYRVGDIERNVADSICEWKLIRGSIADKGVVENIFTDYHPDIVVNLAAQAGVRYSIKNPDAYIENNIIGFYNILEAVRHSYDKGTGVQHLVYASSSSVYGGNKKIPFSTEDNVDHPVSLYAATKKSDELLAHSYSKLYNISLTGLRFFTVYGPAGCPDMAYFSFTEKLRQGEKIKIFNYGNCQRDFTCVDDIVEGVIRVMQGSPKKEIGKDGLPIPPYAIYNIGGGQPENLMDFVHILGEELKSAGMLESNFDIDSHLNLVPMQPGDVPITYADASGLERDYGFKPTIDLRTGLRKFTEWYKEYYLEDRMSEKDDSKVEDNRIIFEFTSEIAYSVADLLEIYSSCENDIRDIYNDLGKLYKFFKIIPKNKLCLSRLEIELAISRTLGVLEASVPDKSNFLKEIKRARRKFIYWGDVDKVVYGIIENLNVSRDYVVSEDEIKIDRSFYDKIIVCVCYRMFLEPESIEEAIEDDKLFKHKVDYEYIEAVKHYNELYPTDDVLSVDIDKVFGDR